MNLRRFLHPSSIRLELVTLPTPLETEERDWEIVDIPLSVARRRIATASEPAPAPATVPPSSPPATREASAGRPPRLRPVHAPQYYPREAYARGLVGLVRVEVTVHPTGVVMGARLLESSGHALLDDAALTSARRWRFAPIRRTRKAEIPFRFGR